MNTSEELNASWRDCRIVRIAETFGYVIENLRIRLGGLEVLAESLNQIA
jgi:hypothetical protein